jgi:tyrosine-specific transport protein
MDGDTNLISMAERTLGKPGKIVAWILYLFLFYTLTIAYVSAGGGLIASLTGGLLPVWLGMFLFVAVLGTFVYLGAAYVDRINWAMMLGLALSYLSFVWLGAHEVEPKNLDHSNWNLALIALPIAFTSFAYQGTVPTLVRYLQRDEPKLRAAVLIGSFLPLLAYGLWQWLVHGIVPVERLIQAAQNNQNAVVPLKEILRDPRVSMAAQGFAFFAIITSFLGVTLGLRDFLADGLQVEKDRQGRLVLCTMIFVPPILVSLGYPDLFLSALGLAGGFGCAILLGLLPVLMVWAGRYQMCLPGRRLLPGGKVVLVLLMLFVVFEVGCEIAHLLHR